jgi:hypothetical protein
MGLTGACLEVVCRADTRHDSRVVPGEFSLRYWMRFAPVLSPLVPMLAVSYSESGR